MRKVLLFLLLIIILTGCKGKDGEDGKVYVEAQWTSDINALDISSVIKGGENPTIFYQNTPYELEPEKSGFVYWRSNSTWYFYPIQVSAADSGGKGSSELLFLPKDGDDGKDIITTV